MRQLLPIAFALLVAVTAGAAEPEAAESLRSRVDAIEARIPRFQKQLDELRSAGKDVAYPLVTFTVLKNFTAYMREDLGAAVPNVWGLTRVSGCGVSYEPSPDAHGGKWAARIVHTSPRAGNIYGMFENSATIGLKAGRSYTLSVWAKINDDTATLSMPVDAGWNSRLAISTLLLSKGLRQKPERT